MCLHARRGLSGADSRYLLVGGPGLWCSARLTGNLEGPLRGHHPTPAVKGKVKGQAQDLPLNGSAGVEELLRDYAVPRGIRRRLRAVGGARLGEDVADVPEHGVDADDQRVCYLLVALPSSDEAQHFDFALR